MRPEDKLTRTQGEAAGGMEGAGGMEAAGGMGWGVGVRYAPCRGTTYSGMLEPLVPPFLRKEC